MQIQAKARRRVSGLSRKGLRHSRGRCTADLHSDLQLWHSTKSSRGPGVGVIIVIKAAIIEHFPMGMCKPGRVMLGPGRFFFFNRNIISHSPRTASVILRTPEK